MKKSLVDVNIRKIYHMTHSQPIVTQTISYLLTILPTMPQSSLMMQSGQQLTISKVIEHKQMGGLAQVHPCPPTLIDQCLLMYI